MHNSMCVYIMNEWLIISCEYFRVLKSGLLMVFGLFWVNLVSTFFPLGQITKDKEMYKSVFFNQSLILWEEVGSKFNRFGMGFHYWENQVGWQLYPFGIGYIICNKIDKKPIYNC